MRLLLKKIYQVPDSPNHIEKYNVTHNSNKVTDDTIDFKRKLNDFWPQLLKEISCDPEFKDMPQAIDWLNKVMEKNVPHGKQYRAFLFLNFYNQMVGDSVKRVEEEKLMVAGWGIEIFQAAALMADDMMDGSETRRGIKCWYKEKDVGMTAVNDSFLLDHLTFFIMYKYFGDQPYFGRLLHHHHSTIMKTIMGQCMDARIAVNVNLNEFTLETYKNIATYKTSYYTFYDPVATAMIMALYKDDAIFDAVRDVTLEMGYLFQVQDDYLDCFGDPNVTGKIGTDIIDGKCTWLIVKALELASDSQRIVFEGCYGKKNAENIKKVKEIYNDLDIEGHFIAFEKRMCMKIFNSIDKLPECLPKVSFRRILNKICKREK